MTWVDLSLPVDEVASEAVPPRIRYLDHREGGRQLASLVGVPVDRLPDGIGWAGEEVTLITHAGTHMDAPWHYGPRCGDRPARRIDEVPLQWCAGPGVVLDLRHLEDDHEISVRDVRDALRRLPRVLQPGDIVLLHTGSDAHWGRPDYAERGPGLGREALVWLLDRGVRVIGIDAWGLDVSFAAMGRRYAATGDPSVIWASHAAGREREYCQLEKLTNLGRLPGIGSEVFCFPVKVARASAGWTRAVARIGGPE